MKKILQWMFLLVLMSAIGTVQAQTFNYTCNFEAESDTAGWMFHNGTSNSWFIGTATNNTVDGTKSLYVSSDSLGTLHQYNNGESCFIYAYREMTLEAGTYDVMYDWKAMGEGSGYYKWDYLRVALIPSAMTLPVTDPYNFDEELPVGWISLDENVSLNQSSDWNTMVTTADVTTAGSFKLVFFWRNDYSGGVNPPAAIDNIVFKAQTCPKAQNFVVTNPTSDGATLSWTEVSTATEWQIEYGPIGFQLGTGTTETIFENPYTLMGLTPNTMYEVYLTSVCAAGDSSAWVSNTFRTGCSDIVLPYFDGFESGDDGYAPYCWFPRLGVTEVYQGSYNSNTGMKALNLENGGVILSPRINVNSNEIGIYFAASMYNNTAGSIEIGFVSDTVEWDYVPIKTISAVDYNYHYYQVDFDEMEDIAEGGHIVISQKHQTSIYGAWYIDDVQIFELGTCRAPHNFEFSEITNNSATLSWSCATSDANFKVKYGRNLVVDVVNATTVTLTDLTSDSVYIPMIRTDCGGTDSSYWLEMGWFKTEPTCARIVESGVQNITPTSAAISWVYSNRGVATTSAVLSWKVDSLDVWNDINVTGNGYFFTGLTPSVKYNVRISALCGQDTSDMVTFSFTTPSGICGESIGDGSSISDMIPLNDYYNYSYSQSLYDKQTVMGMDTIYGIVYNSTTKYAALGIRVWIGNTNKTEYASGDDFVPYTNMTLAYRGAYRFSGAGLDTIMFTTPFVPDGRNLVICIEDTLSGYSGTYDNRVKFHVHTGSTLYRYIDGSAINPTSIELYTSSYVPDLYFVGNCNPPTCVAPLVSFVAADESSLTFSWIPGLDETAWTIDYRIVGDTAWTSFNSNVTDTFAVITGLNASTIYEVRVGSICSDDAKYSMAQGVTSCGNITIPYEDSFVTGNLNMCWGYGNLSPYTTITPSIISDYLYLPSSTYVILPATDEDINTLQLTFHLNDNGTNAPLYVGVCSSNNNISSFEVVDTIYIDRLNPDAEIISRLSSYTGDGQYITFKTGANMIDMYDMKIDFIPTCPTPIRLHATTIGGTYISVEWETDATAQSWNATIVPTGEDISTGTPISCSTASAVFSDLSVNTTYDIYISAVCNTSNSDATMITITTLATDPLQLPFITNFSDAALNAKWTMYNRSGDNKWIIGPTVSNGNANAMYISDDNGVTNHYTTNDLSAAMAYVPVIISETNMHAIAYDWKCEGESSWDFGRVALVPIDYDFSIAPTSRDGYLNDLPTGWIALDNGKLNLHPVWQTMTKKLNVEAGNYLLTFVWFNDGTSGSNPPIAIDNLTFSQVTCSDPVGVTFSGITSSSATVSWRSDINAINGWEVSLNNGVPVIVTDTFYTFDELTFGTTYNVSIRTICGDDSYSIPVVSSFTTICADIDVLPYRNNFDNITNGSQPICWTPASYSYPQVENGALTFYCDTWDEETNTISMPRLGNAYNMNMMELAFRAKADTWGNTMLQVGVSSTLLVDSTFTVIQTLNLTDEWSDYVISLNNYTDTGRYITFKTDVGYEYNSIIDIDDVVLMAISPCSRPTQVSINNYTHNSATVTWVDTNDAATFKVAISNVNDVTTATVIEDITTSSYTFTDLMGSTLYHVWVAASCGDIDEMSGWVYAGRFTTYPTCGEVTGLRVYDITENSATVSWRAPLAGEPVTDYIVSIKMNNNNPTIDTLQVPYIFLDNLFMDSTYVITVNTLCDTTMSFSNTCTFVPKPVAGCNTVGTGTLLTNYAPVYTNYRYSISQMIYKADEVIGMGDTIHGITFTRQATGGNAVDTRQIVVYMGLTNRTDCLGGWVDTNTLTVVYRGAWNLSVGDCDIDFATPFIYSDRSKNLVVMIDDNTGSYKYSQFYCTATDDIMTLYEYDDYTNVGVQSLPSSSYMRPNIRFDATCSTITCFPPSIVVTNLSDTSVSLVWNEGNDETAWKVEYRVDGEDTWTVISANTSVKSATITDLLPGTVYYIRVGSICGSEVTYRTINIVTDCGPMPTPFKENFNNEPVGEFEKNCWTAHCDSWTDPEIANIVGNGKMLLMADNPYVILPEVQGNLNELQLRMRYLTPNDSVATIVGYVTNPNDFGTFIPVDTIYDVNSPSGSYSTVLFNTISASATGNIAFCSHETSEVLYDDIIVEPIRTCVEPTDVQVSNVTATSVDVSWNGNATNYQVIYGETGFMIRGEVGTVISATGSTTTINGLNSGTSYDVTVRAICGSGDTSYASNPTEFLTECAPLTTLPYVMNFELAYLPPLVETERIPNCWSIAYMDDSNATDANLPQVVAERIGDNFTINGDYALRMDATGMIALPKMGVDMDTLCLRFFNKVTSISSRIVVGVLDNLGDGCESTFQVIDTIVPYSVGDINQYSVYFHNYTGTGKYIALRTMSIDPLASLSRQYFDSVVVDYIPSCPEIINLEVSALGSSTITIDWEDILAPASSYEVVYGAPGFNLNSTGTSVIANAHPFVITGLSSLTNYEIWVRPICGDGDTGVFCMHPLMAQTSMCDNPIISTTAPNGVTGQNKDYPFDAYREYSYCQTIIDAAYIVDQTDITAVSFNSSLGSDGRFNNCKIYLGNTTKTKFTGSMDWIPISNMSLVYTGNLDFDAGMVTIMFDSTFTYDGTSNLVIAIDRDADAWHSNHYIDVVADTVPKTLIHSADYDNQDPANPTYTGTLFNGHAAFQFITCGNSCAAPVLSAVTDLTHESATINWSGASENYEVAIRAEEEVAMSVPIAVTANTYTFTNLTPNVNYTYYVRQICEDGALSDWAEGYFTTADLPCYTPTNPIVISKTAETITLSWTAAEGQTKWSIHVFNTMEDHLDTVMANPGTVTGLTGGQTYSVTVNAICATNYASEWSDTISVSTTDCLPVSGVGISGITGNSAKVSWTAGGSETAWQINYGEAGFGQGEGTFVDVTTNSYVMTNLEEETEYDVYVRAMCSANFNSSWSEKITFQTTEGGTPQGIDGVEGRFSFVIYPNPTSGATTISLNGVEGEVTISVVDMNGRTIVSEGMQCGSDCEKRVDVTGLAQGTYFVRVLGDNINSVRKLIVR